MKNLKTTISGWLTGAPVIIMDLLDAYQKGTFDAKHGVALFAAIGVIVLGHLSKDHNTTGGTIQQ